MQDQNSSLPSVLETIVAHKRREVMARQDAQGPVSLEGAPPPRDFLAALRRQGRDGPVRLIAEVKKASPSRGVLRADFDPLSLALTYAGNGAAAISVLTDETFFHGHTSFLQVIRGHVDVPVLRKEFIIDAWQIAESRALGADSILLIVALLDDQRLGEFMRRAGDLGMACLVEVHTGQELDRALGCGAKIIGINNRDLHTFKTTLETTELLGPVVTGAGRLLVSESGIHAPEHVERVAAAGAEAVLVGEAIVCAGDVAGKVRELSGVTPGPGRSV